jgi:hypothetical protein
MPLNINNLTAGTPVAFNAQTSVHRMVFDSATVAFQIVNNTTGIVTVLEENSDSFICQVDPGATAFGLMQNAILVEAQYPGPVILTPYTWIPVSSGNANTWTAQNIFKSPSATVAGGVFQSSGTVSAISAGYGGSNLVAQFIAEESSVFPYTLYEATGNSQGHILAFRQSRGTYASRTATQSGDLLGQLNFGGHNGTALVDNKARIQTTATETYTAGANGTNLQFFTTAAGASTPTLSLTLIGGFALFTGQVVGTDFQLSNSAGNTRTIFFRTSSSTRWTLVANSTAESGGNAGSNFEISRWSDTQAFQGHIIQATRSTGDITFNSGGGTSTFTNDVIAPFVQVNRPAGNVRPILYRSGGSTRWAMQATATAESGSNVGSDWALDAHTDAGAYNFTALTISRSGGNAVFYNLLTAPQLRISLSNAPASATATGSAGTIRWDANYIYVCTATDTWKRVAIATWP